MTHRLVRPRRFPPGLRTFPAGPAPWTWFHATSEEKFYPWHRQARCRAPISLLDLRPTRCTAPHWMASRHPSEPKRKNVKNKNSSTHVKEYSHLRWKNCSELQLETKHMAPPGGATSTGQKQFILLLVAPPGGAMCFVPSCTQMIYSNDLKNSWRK